MAVHLESPYAIRNLLANEDGTNPALTPPPSDGSASPNDSVANNENYGSRPYFTYSALVAMAIRSSPEGKLTLSAIQSWISENFPFYRKEDQRWQSQIRQTLSTNSCFHKVPRPLTDPGRGNYWVMSPEVGAVHAQDPVAANDETVLQTMVRGVPHPQTPNAVYFPTPCEIQGAQLSMWAQAVQEQYAWYQYHLHQIQILQQQLAAMQQQQFQQQMQQQYQELYQKQLFHQQQIEFLSAQQLPA